MLLDRVHALLDTCTTHTPLFPPTQLYNEGWLLRLILDWYSTHPVATAPLAFSTYARWFSEALLPSAFLPRYRGDPLAETQTHADGVIGQFTIGHRGKADLVLAASATQLVVCEAKMFSDLSSNVKNANYFDQAARNVACIAEVLKRAMRPPSEMVFLGFYVLAPQSQIARFAQVMAHESIQQKVERRVQAYTGERDQWYQQWFKPTLQYISIRPVSWEDIIMAIGQDDRTSGDGLKMFYQRCIEFNQPARNNPAI